MNDRGANLADTPPETTWRTSTPIGDDLNRDDHAIRWWALALRGLVAIAFGILAFVVPAAAFLSLVLVFAAYALIDGVFAVVAGVRREGSRNWLLILGGLAGIFIGIVTPFVPGLTGLLLVTFIGWWALITGGLELGGAIAAGSVMPGRWLVALNGVLSILLGALIVLFPGVGAVVLVLFIAAYAVASGIMLLVLAFQLRSHRAPMRQSRGSRAPA
jgi:uncharacterized membrane protein HdeD (DUF308 family)